jgi:hypothetical protein
MRTTTPITLVNELSASEALAIAGKLEWCSTGPGFLWPLALLESFL